MSAFVPVASVSEVPASGKLLCEVGDRLVVVIRVGDEYFCIDDVCTHDGGPLGEGRLDGYEIACPRHGARFDVRNGWAKTMPATENTASHEVRVEGHQIFVRFRDNGDSSSSAPIGTAAAADATGANSSTGANGAGASPAGSSDSAVSDPGASSSLAVVGGAPLAAASAAADATCQAAPLLPAANDTAGDGQSGELSAITEDRVREELKRVVDPELFVNIVDLGLVYNVDLTPNEDGRTRVKIDMTMTSPMCPAGPQMIAQCKQVLGQNPRVENVEVRIVMDPPWSPDKMSEAARDQLGLF